MVITVIGTGFVGVVTAAVFAKLGHTVFGLDVDAAKISQLKQGKVPFYEPRLQSLVAKGLQQGKLFFTTLYKEAIPNSEVIIIAVGTPAAVDGTADLRFVMAAADEVAKYLKDGAIVAIKSTVPPSTTTKVRKVIEKRVTKRFFMASLPEFLREGSAVADTLQPERIVIGAEEDEVKKRLLALHEALPGERVIISSESAQIAKYSANAYLAMRITFINQIANLCEFNGAHIGEVIEAIGYDSRIGRHYWYPGLGYGGSCFPKDVKELAAYARSIGEGDGLLVKIDELNDARVFETLKDMNETVGGFDNKTVAVLGLSFKPHTNDMREAPSLKVIPYLQQRGAEVRAYDPKAMPTAKKLFKQLKMAGDVEAAVDGADVLMLLTEWPQLVDLDFTSIKKLMKPNAWVLDTRNQYDKDQVMLAGLNYRGIGNP
jgi:UDPglucose 6-dehydrogenase